MTRELIFINSFEPQLTAFTTWHSLVDSQAGGHTPLAPSDYPGFEIIPGEAKYPTFDPLGFPRSGTQAFTLRVVFRHAQLAVASMRSLRAGDVQLIESFFSGGFVPPAPLPGDTARIDSIQLQNIAPAVLDKTATRSSITVQAMYTFTLFKSSANCVRKGHSICHSERSSFRA